MFFDFHRKVGFFFHPSIKSVSFLVVGIWLGGKREPNDSSYIDCALRETEEEIGIPRKSVTIWGETSLMHISKPLSIMPVIGSISNYDSTQLKVNKDEVERVFAVSITELCEQKKHTQFRPWIETNKKIGRFTSNKSYSVPVFTVRDERIWGITAMMTHLFLHSLLPAESYHHQIPYIPMFKWVCWYIYWRNKDFIALFIPNLDTSSFDWNKRQFYE